MDKLKMHSLDGVKRNIERIGKLFPNAITEVKRSGRVEHAIDFDVLRQELSGTIVEGREERYQFTWPDKKKAVLAANAPITATLRPVVADSIGKDGTPGGFDSENLYIEGDNLEVLKLLQETYLGRVKMIYIDPPYNTGNDFIYEDNFAQGAADYMGNSGQYDEAGNRMVTNTERNGRFHTDWLNMIYPRLKLAKDLLAEEGFIAISIGEEEADNLKKTCDEIFGQLNFRNIIEVRRYDKNLNLQFVSEGLSTMNIGLEYIYVYSKTPFSKMTAVYKKPTDEREMTGYWKGFWNNADRPTMRYEVLGYTPTEGQWKWKKEVAQEAIQNYHEYEEKYSSALTLEEYWPQRKREKYGGRTLGITC